ncbi:MAG: hypothetical protein JWO31_658, partial [Phycisphaerales bacterium]|nr:hypothetical protein [Phycisphaerales bacterium]
NVNLSLPNNLARIQNGSASLTITGSGIAGSVSNLGSFSVGAGLQVNLTSLNLAWDTRAGQDNDIKIGAAGAVTVGGDQKISGSFAFERNGSGVQLGVSGATVNLGTALSVANLSGTLQMTAAGYKGTGAATVAATFTSSNTTFGGTFGFSVDTTAADKNLKITGQNVQVTAAGLTFEADLAFSQIAENQGLIGASVANLTATLGDGTNNYVTIASPTGPSDAADPAFRGAAFLFQNGGFAGAIDVDVTVAGPNGVGAHATGVFRMNTGADVVSFPDPLDRSKSLQIPAGPFAEAYLRNTAISLSPTQQVTGDFGFKLSTDGGNRVVVNASAANVNATFGTTTLASASGSLTISAALSKGVAGTLTGTASLGGGSAAAVSGSLTVTADETGFHLGGTDVSVVVLGQTITGSFAVDAQAGSTKFTIVDATLAFGNGLLAVNALTGDFTVAAGGAASGTVSGQVATTIGQATFAGGVAITFGASDMALAGADDTLTVGAETITGDFAVSTTGAGDAAVVTVAASGVRATLGGGLVKVGGNSANPNGATFAATIAGGQFSGSLNGTVSAGAGVDNVDFNGPVVVSVGPDAITAATAPGQQASLTVAGKTFSAAFAFAETDAGLSLAVSGVNLSLGGGALAVTGAAGTLVVRADKQGVDGAFAAAFSSNVVGFSGNLAVAFADGTVTFEATGASLTVAGQTIGGDMVVTTAPGGVVRLAATNLYASLGGGLVTVRPPAADADVPASTLKIDNGAFSGTFSGAVSAGSAAGIGFDGIVSVTVAPGDGITVRGRDNVLNVLGQQITADYDITKTAAGLNVHLSDVDLSLGSVLSIRNAAGDLSVTAAGVTGSASGTVRTSIVGFSGLLAIAFDADGMSVSGQNDKLQFGDIALAGSFDFVPAFEPLPSAASADAEAGAGLPNLPGFPGVGSESALVTPPALPQYGPLTAVRLSITDFALSFGGLVQATDGTADLNVNITTGTVTGTAAGTVLSGPTLAAAGIRFGGTVAVAVDTGIVRASVTDGTLDAYGQSFAGSFTFYEDANGLEVTAGGVGISIGGGLLAVTGGSGTLRVTPGGLVGSTAGTVTSTLAGFSGTLGVSFAPGTLTVNGTNDSLTIAGQTIAGDFTFSTVAGSSTNLQLDVSNLTADLGGRLVTVGRRSADAPGATATLTITNGQASGQFTGYVAAGSTTTGVTFGGLVSVTVAPEGLTASGTGVSLTVAAQKLTGGFTFARDAATQTVQLTLADVGLSLGGALSITDVAGVVTVGGAGVVGDIAGTVDASIAGLSADRFGIKFAPGTLAISATGGRLSVGGQTVAGDFAFLRDAAGLHLTSSNLSANLGNGLVTVAGGAADLKVADGKVTGTFGGNVAVGGAVTGGAVGFAGLVTVTVKPSAISAAGTGDTLTIAGYQLTTDFTFAKDPAGLALTVANLNLSLGDALSVTGATGELLVTAEGVTGSAAGTIASNLGGAVQLQGNLAVAFDGDTVAVSGTNNKLVAGGQTVSGDFTFVKSADSIELTAANLAASLGGGLVTVANGSGALSVGGGTVSGSFAGTIAAGTVGGGVSFSGPIAVSVGAGGIFAATPEGQVDTLAIAGQTVSAGFSFAQDAAGLELTVTNLNASLGGGALSLLDAGGTLLVTRAGVSGTAAGRVSASFTGFEFTGGLAATFAPGLLKLSGTDNRLTAGDQSIGGDFDFVSDATGLHLSAANLTASIGGGLVTVSDGTGQLDVAGGTVTGGFAGEVAAGNGVGGVGFSGAIGVEVGVGSITARTLAGHTNTLTLPGQSLAATFFFHRDVDGLLLDVGGVNLSFGNGTVAVRDAGGSLLVTKAGVTGSLSGGLSANVPGVTFNSTNFAVSFASGANGGPATVEVAGTGVSLSAYGQEITGNFRFAQTPDAVTLHVDNLGLAFGGVVRVSAGVGDFALTKGPAGGMRGSASGDVAVDGGSADIAFGGTYEVSVGGGAVKVTGTGATLTLFGQTISGDFAFAKVGTAVELHVNGLILSLGDGLVGVTGGAADLVVGNGGVTGAATGTLSVGSDLSGVSFGGTVSVAFTPTALAVTGTGVQLTVAGQTLSADLAFARDSASGLLAASVSNLQLSSADAPSPISFSGNLLVMPTGLSGSLVGTGSFGGVNGQVTASFGNGTYTITAGISAEFNEQIGPVSVSGKIAAEGSTNGTASVSLTNLMVSLGNGLLMVTGGSATFARAGGRISGTATGRVSLNGLPGVALGGDVTLNVAPSAITVSGSNLSLSVVGQTLAGDFTFNDNGNGTVTVTASGVTVALADVVALTNGTANLTLGGSTAAAASRGVKGTGSGTLAVNLPGVGFDTAFGLTIDTTGGQQTFVIAANPVTFTVGGTSLTGRFVVQKVTTAAGKSTVSLVASGLGAFVGDGTTGVRISDAGGSVLFLPTGVALDVYGSAELVGITGLTLGGTLHVRVNNTGAAVRETVPAPDAATPGATVPQLLTFTANELSVAGTATLAVGDGSGREFVALRGGFSFSQSATTVGSVTITKVLIAAAGLNAFLGVGPARLLDGTVNPDAAGVLVENANLGLVVFGTRDASRPTGQQTSSKYALNAAGRAALLGVTGLTVSGTLAVRVNTAGAVSESVLVPDPLGGAAIPVSVNFAANAQQFSGTGVTLAVATPGDPTQQLVSLTGDFAFDRSVVGTTTTIKVAATNVGAFVGVGGSDPVGLQVAGGNLGLVLVKTGTAAMTYALAAGGNVSLVGLPGLDVGGGLNVRVNTTGSAQPNPADLAGTIPAGSAPVINVDNLTFAIKDSSDRPVLAISVDATIQRIGGLLSIDATRATFGLTVAGQSIVDLSGTVQFTLGANGLNLGARGFQITGFSILSSGSGAAPNAVDAEHGDSQNSDPSAQNTPDAQSAVGATTGGATPGQPGSTGSMGTVPSLATPTGTPRKIGPLSLYNLAPVFNGFSFKNGQLEVNLGLKADSAVLTFGGSAAGTGGGGSQPATGGTTAILSAVSGTFRLAVGLDLSSFRVTNFGPTGGFTFQAGRFVLNVPNVVNVDASNITVQYNPRADNTQKLISIETATVTVPMGQGGTGGIQGQLAPIKDANGNSVPGLAVYGDHFQLGRGTLRYLGTLSFSSLVQFRNPFVSITDLSVSYASGIDFKGSISIGAESVILGPSAAQVTGTNVAATLTRDGGGNWGFSFTAGSVGLKLGPIAMTATNVAFNPLATGTQQLISLSGLQVSVSLSKLTLTGSAGSATGQIVVRADGSFSLPQNFSIGVTIGAGTSGELGWPTWIPIQIKSIVLTWPDLSADAGNFTITLSAKVTGTYGTIQLDGDIENVVIDVNKLRNGQFPITSIDSAAVSAKGDVFGGELEAALILGVVKLDASNRQVAPGAAFDHTVFYAGIDGGFTTAAGYGLHLRFGLSEKGPLSAYVSIDANIIVEPTTQLAIKSLAGGISFDAQPFPSISNAADLKSPVFAPSSELTLEQWQKQLKQAVVNQAGGGAGGYLFTVAGAAADAAGLDNNNVTEHLKAEFLTYGYTLAGTNAVGLVKTKISAVVANKEWVVVDGSKFYVLTRDLAGGLVVTGARFAIDANGTGAKTAVPAVSAVATALRNGTFNADLTAAFAAYGISLTGAAKITAAGGAQAGVAWTIAEGAYTFVVTLDANNVLTVQSSGGSLDVMSKVIRIEASVTMGIGAIPEDELSITGNVIISTDGKILLNAYAKFGGGGSGQELNFRAYFDLSNVASGNVKILFYFEQYVELPGGTMLKQLVVAGGATLGLTDSNGAFIDPADTTTPADGFGIRLDGLIEYSPVPLATLTLKGQVMISFGSDKFRLDFNASLSANIASFIQASNVVAAAGSFVVQYGGGFKVWGAARIVFTSGAIPFLDQAGIKADAQVYLRINSDADDTHAVTLALPAPGQANVVQEQTFDLEPASFGLYMVGALRFDKGPVSFALEGVFAVDFKYDSAAGWRFNLFVFSELRLGVAGQQLFQMNALGMLQINDRGFAAVLAISRKADLAVLKFNFDFTLFVNTTGRAVTYTLPPDLTAILGQMSGVIPAGGFSATDKPVSGPSINVGLLGDLTAELNRLNTLYGAGNGGFASTSGGVLSITVPAGMPQLAENGASTGTAAPGPYLIIQGHGDLVVLNTFTLTGSFKVQASLSGVSMEAQARLHMGPLADIAASGSLQITASGLVASISLAANIGIGGVATLSGAATLEVNTTGADQTVKEFQYDYGSGQVSNTPTDVVIPGGQLVLLRVMGRLKLAGTFSLSGSFLLTLTNDSTNGVALSMAVEARLDAFFGISLRVNGGARIITGGSSGPGLVLSLTVSAGMNVASLVTVNGSVTLDINTFAGTKTVTVIDNGATRAITVAPGVRLSLSAEIAVLGILRFNATGEIRYNSAQRVFTLSLSGSANVNLLIFNVGMQFGGWIDSTGQFAVTMAGSAGIDLGIASLDGSAYLTVAYTVGAPQLDGNHMPITPATPQVSGRRVVTIAGGATLSGKVLGITVGSISVNFRVDSDLNLYLDISVHLSFFFFSIDFGFTINAGSFGGNKPPTVYLAGTPTAAQLSPADAANGPIVVNVGDRAPSRNYDTGNRDEKVVVQGGDDYNATTKRQTIYLTVNGYTQAYRGVSQVFVPGKGANNIQIADNVRVPVDATGGAAGKPATIVDAGLAGGTLTGGPAADLIQTGSGKVTVNGGGGNDTVVLGSGPSAVNTKAAGGGKTKVLWNPDTSGSTKLTGNGSDELVVTANTPGTAYAAGERLALTPAGAGQALFTHTLNDNTARTAAFAGFSDVTLSAPGGGNTIAVGDLTGTGVRNLTLSYGQTHRSGNRLTLAGSAGRDTYTLAAGTGTLPVLPNPQVPSAYTTSSLDLGRDASSSVGGVDAASFAPLALGSTDTAVKTVTVSQQNGLTVNLYGADADAGDGLAVNGGGGGDTFYVGQVIIPTTVQGNDATAKSDGSTTTYFVGYQGAGAPGSLAPIDALFTVVGTNATDVVVLEDAADSADRQFAMTSTEVISGAFGPAGRIAYDGSLDNLNLNAGPGDNRYVMSGTASAVRTQIVADNTDNAFVIDGPITSPLAINGGSAVSGSNTLTVNGVGGNDSFVVGPNKITGLGADLFYTNLNGITVNGGDGTNAYTLNGNTAPLTVLGGRGDDTVVVNATGAPTTIDGGDGNDAFTVNGSGAPTTITGRQGNYAFTVNGNGAPLSLVGGAGSNMFTVRSNTNALTLTGGAGQAAANTFDILGNAGSLTVNTNTGGSTAVNVSSVAAGVLVNDAGAPAAYHVTGPLAAPITVVGDGTARDLVVDATGRDEDFVLTPTALLGLGAPITYGGLLSVTINGAGGSDTFRVDGNSAPTTINAAAGGRFDVRAIDFPLTLNTGDGTSTVILGSTQGVAGGRLDTIKAAVTVNGSGRDALTLDDRADALPQTAVLTDATIAGIGVGFGGVTYAGVATLSVRLGSGADAVTVEGTAAATATTVDTAAGSDTVNVRGNAGPLAVATGDAADTVNVGSLAPAAGGTLAGVAGKLTITGGSNDTLNLDAAGDVDPRVGTLAPAALAGVGTGPDGIAFAGLAQLNLTLGGGGNVLTVLDTPAAANTTIAGGDGNDTINVRAATGQTRVVTGAGTNAVNVGSTAGTETFGTDAGGGTITGVRGGLAVEGRGTDTLTVAGPADAADRTGTLSPANLLGLGMGPVGIGYAAVEALNVLLGSGDTRLTVLGTSDATATTVTTGAGNDYLDVLATGTSVTTFQTGDGNDTTNLNATAGPTTVAVGTGTNPTNLGSLAQLAGGTIGGLRGPVTLTGGGTDTINFDDAGTLAAGTGTLTATDLTGFGTAGVSFAGDTGLAALNLTLGNAGNAITVAGTPVAATTTVTTGDGADAVTVDNTGGPTTVLTAGGNDVVRVRGTAAATVVNTGTGSNTVTVGSSVPATLDGIQGGLTVAGNVADTLTFDDAGNAVARSGTLGPTTLTGFGMAADGVTYTGVGTVNLNLGSGGTVLAISGTAAAATTNVTGGAGSDAITLAAAAGRTTIAAGTGTNAVAVQTTDAPVTVTTAAGAADAVVLGLNGSLDALRGPVTVAGNGADTLVVDDVASAGAKSGELSPVELKGLSPAVLAYAGLAKLTVNLGRGTQALSVLDTAAATTTTIDGGAGNATLTLEQISGPTTIVTGPALNAVRVRATRAALTVTSGAGASDTVTLGRDGSADAVAGPVAVVGNGSTRLDVDDAAATAGKTGSLTPTALTGVAPAAVTYGGVATLTIALGGGDDAFTIDNTAAATATSVSTAGGNDAVTVRDTAGVTSVDAGTGTNSVNVLGTSAATRVATAPGGASTVTVGNNGSTAAVRGPMTVAGNGADT